MWKNTALKRFSERTVGKIARYCGCFRTRTYTSKDEKTPLLKSTIPASMETKFSQDFPVDPDNSTDPTAYDEILIAKAVHQNEEDAEEEDEKYGVFSFPRGEGCWTIIEWVLGWPARILFTLTIPDCRKGRFRKFYPLTFIMCIVYIALLSYVVSWLMTIIAKQGLGSMSISNSIGSNTFDILICLGLPWLIRASMIANDVEGNFIQINSGGLEYSAIILIISLALLYGMLALNGFYLDKKVATISTILYAIFLVFASLLEMNVFFVLNQPTCSID
ncbi:unnamed protein product [Allacma fusca]|uniref:Sodium/calcium exchanger membrane region domain-containing protein n=1 Tax=Allacma fusca TaxID=39272 RepID=A0A8J2LLS7_9HEXA|nr:unnamed protein product [Allacma fusca]